MSDVTAVQRCKEYYENVYQTELKRLQMSHLALDECIQHFLDQRPANGKKYSNKDRAVAFASSSFLRDIEAISSAKRASLALAKVLQYDDAISHDQLDFLASNTPDVLRWAIRFSKLFTRENSALWLYLKVDRREREWDKFFYVCNELNAVLKPFQNRIDELEAKLSSLNIISFFSYLSVLAYDALTKNEQLERHQKIYQRIVLNRLQKSTPQDFAITEMSIAISLKTDLSPIIFPSSDISLHCKENLALFSELIYATGELLDYENSANWFSFDEECGYTDQSFRPVIFNTSNQRAIEWEQTNKKLRLLWNYWMKRAIDELIIRGLHDHQFGLAENQELNQLAYIKAIRSELMLKEVYGFADKLETDSGIHIDLFKFMLFAELNSVFFQKDYIDEFKSIYEANGSLFQSLSMLAFNGLVNGMQNRFPMTWSTVENKVNGLVGWSVSPEFPSGNKNITKAIIDSWTVDLKELASHNSTIIPRLNERPYYKIGSYLFQFPWVVGHQNNANSAVNNLRRVGARRKGVKKETNRIEQNISELLRQKGMNVVCGYNPKFAVGQENPGEIDVIAYADGVLLLIEVKSGYIRSSRQEAWLHKTSTLRKAAWQLCRKENALKEAVLVDTALREQLNFQQDELPQMLKSWIVDTSLEFDGKEIDGYLVTSLETMIIALRDEKSFLNDFEEIAEDDTPSESYASLYQQSFSITEFIRIIESGRVWQGLI
ncbi:NERD domain-containing protein [Tolumonas osonensis]|uniref:Holliday junction resolvase-like predicted endonuclease n=1 Tax=Tolumonas osonensis TaxID=675874 RepID=A0A841GPQ1_9GAMM|nr:Holliday junction resolvase-like predicted endonuclease [Tolumonas osonensis]